MRLYVVLILSAIISNINAQYVLLLKYDGNALLKLDSIPLIENGIIEYPSTALVGRQQLKGKSFAFMPGVYEIAIGKETKAFVIDKEVDNIKCKIKNSKIVNFQSNFAFDAMNKMIGQWNGLNKRYNESVMMNRQSDKSKTEIDSIDRLLLKESFDRFLYHYAQLDSLAEVYPDTYVSKVLVPIYKKPIQKGWIKYPQERWQYAAHYFDNWDYSQPGFFNNPLVKMRLMEFIRYYNPVNTAEAHINTVTKIMDKAEFYPEAKIWMLNFLLELYLKMGPEEVVFYLYDNYIEGCSSQHVAMHHIKRVLQLKNLKPGVEAKHFELVDYSGKKYTDWDFKKEGKGVIYIFWSSECSHCQEELPKLLPVIANNYKDMYEIITVSTEREEKKYKDFIEKNNLKIEGVTHIFEGKGLEGALASTYFVYGTPSVYIIDKKNRFRKRVSGLRGALRWLEKAAVIN